MNHTPTTPTTPFQPRRDRGVLALGMATGVAWVVAVGVTAGLAFGLDWAGATMAWLVAAGVGVLAALVTLPLLVLVASQIASADADQLVKLWAFVLLAGAMRMIVVGLGVILPVKLYGTATWPTFGFVATHYTLLTLAEVGVLGRLFWRKDATSPAPPLTPPAEPALESAPDSPAAPSAVR